MFGNALILQTGMHKQTNNETLCTSGLERGVACAHPLCLFLVHTGAESVVLPVARGPGANGTEPGAKGRERKGPGRVARGPGPARGGTRGPRAAAAGSGRAGAKRIWHDGRSRGMWPKTDQAWGHCDRLNG